MYSVHCTILPGTTELLTKITAAQKQELSQNAQAMLLTAVFAVTILYALDPYGYSQWLPTKSKATEREREKEGERERKREREREE